MNDYSNLEPTIYPRDIGIKITEDYKDYEDHLFHVDINPQPIKNWPSTFGAFVAKNI